MEYKTNVEAEEGKQEIIITREFDLPVDLLFKAYTDPELVEQWMGTQVVKLENKSHGSYRFVTTDPKGNQHGFNGTIHEFIPNLRITRTFEMEQTSFPVQLEFLMFEKLTTDRSKLVMQVIYKSVADRDNMLKLPFTMGINMAHNRLEQIVQSLK
jgi:uncharacterized protein YndB with AHSA1/START domain